MTNLVNNTKYDKINQILTLDMSRWNKINMAGLKNIFSQNISKKIIFANIGPLNRFFSKDIIELIKPNLPSENITVTSIEFKFVNTTFNTIKTFNVPIAYEFIIDLLTKYFLNTTELIIGSGDSSLNTRATELLSKYITQTNNKLNRLIVDNKEQQLLPIPLSIVKVSDYNNLPSINDNIDILDFSGTKLPDSTADNAIDIENKLNDFARSLLTNKIQIKSINFNNCNIGSFLLNRVRPILFFEMLHRITKKIDISNNNIKFVTINKNFMNPTNTIVYNGLVSGITYDISNNMIDTNTKTIFERTNMGWNRDQIIMNNMTIIPDSFTNVEGFGNMDNKNLYIIIVIIIVLLCIINLFLLNKNK